MRLIQCLTAIWLLSLSRATLAAELVSFPSLDGSLTGGAPTELRGLLVNPEGSGPFPAVVSLKDRSTPTARSAICRRNGIFWATMSA
jgi:hypothetical protein